MIDKLTEENTPNLTPSQRDRFNKFVHLPSILKKSENRNANAGPDLSDEEYYSDTNNIRKVLVNHYLKRYNERRGQ